MRKVRLLLWRQTKHNKTLTTTLTPYSIFRVGGESGRWSMEVDIPFSTSTLFLQLDFPYSLLLVPVCEHGDLL